MSSAEAMGELAKVLASVKDTTKILFDYQEVAKWSIRGQSLQASGGGGYVTMTSPVAGWFEGYVVLNQNNEIVKKDCSEEGVNHYIEMTQRFKSYPFPYYVLAECEKELNRPEWQTNMNTAYEILAKTSTYLLRSPDHDRYFAKITEFKGFEIDTILNGTPR